MSTSNRWVSKTSSNYEYRPLTSLIDKYDLMEENLTEEGREIMYRSYVTVQEVGRGGENSDKRLS